jgi:uncharacterized membrane protein YfcA
MTSSYGKGFLAGTAIGIFGGLIGLGGAEFRLPLLIGMFMFSPLDAVILNKAMSLIVVGSALPFRTGTVPWSAVAANWPVIVNLLAGSLAGAWAGAGWAVNFRKESLYRIIACVSACRSRGSSRSAARNSNGSFSWSSLDTLTALQ